MEKKKKKIRDLTALNPIIVGINNVVDTIATAINVTDSLTHIVMYSLSSRGVRCSFKIA